MDSEIESTELLEFIEVLNGRREAPDGAFSNGFTLNDREDVFESYQTPVSLSTDFKAKSPPSPHIDPVLPPIEITPRPNSIQLFSCPPIDLVESPLLESPVKISPHYEDDSCPNDCLSKVTNMLESIYPTNFNNRNNQSKTEQEVLSNIFDI